MSRNRFNGKGRWLFFLIVPAVLGGAGLLVMYLWNAILPELLGVAKISFWQSVGLFILCKVLFGNFRKPERANSRMGFGPWGKWEKFKNATPEEREALKEEWRRRCGR